MARKEKNEYMIQSVSLACSLLDQFRGGKQDLSVTDLSRLLRIGKNNVFRLLATLELRNFVEKNPATGAYRLGVTNLKLGASCIRSKHFFEEARMLLEALAKQSCETASLAVLGEDGLVCEKVVKSSLPVRAQIEIGSSLPLFNTAAGKVVLAFCSNEELKPFMKQEISRKYNGQLTTFMRSLSKQRKIVRNKGYAVSFEEFQPDICGVAAPVRNHTSSVIGVISVVGPSYRFSIERLNADIAPLVVRCASEISSKMGYIYPDRQNDLLQATHSCSDESLGWFTPTNSNSQYSHTSAYSQQITDSWLFKDNLNVPYQYISTCQLAVVGNRMTSTNSYDDFLLL